MRIAINFLSQRIEAVKYEKRNTLKNQKALIKCYNDSIKSMTKAINHLRQVNQKCEWIYSGDGTYGTNCGDIFSTEDGFKKANNFKFCPYCGREIREK